MTNTQQLDQAAMAVLEKNWTGFSTKPTPALYPHQWSWDSAFIAMGYAHYNQARAEQELRSLFDAQWLDGRVPHIVFNTINNDRPYFPGPDFWQIHRSPDAPPDHQTSGIVQPPVHATAVLHVYKYAQDRTRSLAFLREMFPKLAAWHRWLYSALDPLNEGLIYIHHPWSSGQDNSPMWDRALQRIELTPDHVPEYTRVDLTLVDADERPTKSDYDCYVYLVDFMRQRDYDEQRIYEDGIPFMVQDVLFNTLLVQANRDLALIAGLIGEDAEPYLSWAENTAAAINDKLWDPVNHIYIDYDLYHDEPIHAHALAGFSPLFARIPDEERAYSMVDYLNSSRFCHIDEAMIAAPSYTRVGSAFSHSRYWRGPVWINMNWLLWQGLTHYDFSPYANRLRNTIVELPSTRGFYEYFHPVNGRGYGAPDFSWTASLLLDVLYRSE
ncbi:MAG: glycoside hydrolase [Chloroflexi bacterium]|nr:glycoside hydrolase [Chloroflexota bacterium]